MKKKYFYSVLFFLLTASALFSQSGWTTLNSSSSVDFLAVNFINPQTGWLGGWNGVLGKTTDGGGTWSYITNSGNGRYEAVKFFNENTGYLGGTFMFKTTNGGATMTQLTHNWLGGVNDMYFVNEQTGWACGNTGGIIATTNGGATWTHTATSMTTGVFALHFADANTGYSGGYGLGMVRTTNGGASWQTMASGSQMNYVTSIFALPGGIVYAGVSLSTAPNGGGILFSTNGFASYNLIYTNTPDRVNALDFINSTTGYAGGGVSGGFISKTTNSGANWYVQRNGVSNVYAMHMLNATTGYAAGLHGTIHKTTTGGDVVPNAPTNLTAAMVSSTQINISWQRNSSYEIGFSIERSPDSNTWNNIATIGTGSTSYSNTGLNPSTKYYYRVAAIGGLGNSAYTNTASALTVPAQPVLSAPANNSTNIVLNPTLAWSEGSVSSLYRVQLSADSMFASNIINDSTITAAAYNITGGLNLNTKYFWRVQAKNAGGWSAYSTRFSFTTGLASPTLVSPADNSTNVSLTTSLLWNTVAGATLYKMQLSADSNFVSFIVNDTALSNPFYQIQSGALAMGTVYYWRTAAYNSGGWSPYSDKWRFTTTGVTGLQSYSTGIPDKFALHNNYPNPFNPVTKIRFDIPASGSVQSMETKITVFDLLGREVKTLVNQNLKPGQYEVDFNAGDIASGIYYYRISANAPGVSYSDVKKMAVIK